ncbi:aconitate hydratase AcnA [Limnohabitans sp. JirII-31]|uniref:aconitate hydratase AcnA n=1 Tax=Limnohabitans sp. JirII-31 TaxID=1977908 RepID=UPI000C1DF495|nr:aconitate hydratase AcnA [Limnohabitans sp. JirII-31]PIT81034.1 aconitate hydratase 1 [Limnohabitans sp. JirII-31]
MENTYPFAPAHFSVNQETYAYVDLPTVCGERLQQLPMVLRLLLENVIRNMQGAEREQAVQAIFDWLPSGTSEAEIAFQPGRVLMHDTTSTPALVDIAAMRNALHEAGVDPAVLNPGLSVDVSIDHSLAVEVFAVRDAVTVNLQHEIRRNGERYRFLRWAASVLQGVRIHPPGTGIMHTINLEQLATVVTTQDKQGVTWAVPDMMIGTDSHTPMVNGIGVLGWGVGGLEAQTVMFGMPTMLRIPDVVGVKLVGQLPPAALATDLALTVTQRLRQLGVTGEFVEFYGPGVSTLSAGDRAVVANMAPEYGATTGFFGIDANTLAYLKTTGRTDAAIGLVEAYAQHAGLWFDPQAEPRYTQTLTIDLSTIGLHVAGPRRPQDLWLYSQTPEALAEVGFTPSVGAGHSGSSVQPVQAIQLGQPVQSGHSLNAVSASSAAIHGQADTLPRHPVAIAAISSCTNTTDPALLVAAGLLARKARALGLRVPAWVKTSLAPGSPAAATYLARAGLLEDLDALGFGIVGYGCTSCIGNTGPLTAAVRDAQRAGQCKGVAILSGNRNFPGRVHPDLELSFIMSPPLVIAFGLCGDAQKNLATEPLQTAPNGQAVYLKDIWPTHEDIAAHVALGANPDDYARDFARATANPLWHALQAPHSPLFPWDERSTILRRPPFAAVTEGSQLGHYSAYPLLVVGDDVTTDHISPASAIPPDSLVADFLVARGDDRHDLNVFASRRGNWEVMLRAAFHSKTLVNLLQPGLPVAHTLHVPSGEVMPIWDAAQRYRDAGDAVVLVAGERYGMGSSRDWAAKGQRLLGIRAVLAVSFERIHRSNLIGMGILPLRMPAGMSPHTLQLQPGDQLQVHAAPELLQPRGAIAVCVRRADGREESFQATAAVETQLELSLLRAGGVIPSILHSTIQAHADHKAC